MTIHCLAHVLNLSAKSLLQGLGSPIYHGCGSENEEGETVHSSYVAAVPDDDDPLDQATQPCGEVVDMVQNVGLYMLYFGREMY
jgi:hypothetical protein